jgi:hypothetical protein
MLLYLSNGFNKCHYSVRPFIGKFESDLISQLLPNCSSTKALKYCPKRFAIKDQINTKVSKKFKNMITEVNF